MENSDKFNVKYCMFVFETKPLRKIHTHWHLFKNVFPFKHFRNYINTWSTPSLFTTAEHIV